MAFEIKGTIADHYNEAGGASSPLGQPTSDELDGPNGGKYQTFDGGVIVFNLATGTYTVWGAIREAWEAQGGPGGPLGYPTSDEQDVDGGKQSNFEHGSISWNPESGVSVNQN